MDAVKKIHENSRVSYKENESTCKGETFRQRIVNLLKQTRESMTDREIFNALNEPDVNNVRPEITRLKQAGTIIETGKVKCPITKKTVRTVCVKEI